MIHAAIYGRLSQDAKPIQTKTGKAMSVTSLAVNLPIAKSEETVTQWFNVIAFNKQAEALQRCQKGDLVGLSGRVQANTFTDRNGEDKTQLQLIADSVVSARTVRPSGNKKRQSQAPAQDFNDEISF